MRSKCAAKVQPPDSLLLTSSSIPRFANSASADDADLSRLSGGQFADERSSPHVLKGRHHPPRSVQVVILASFSQYNHSHLSGQPDVLTWTEGDRTLTLGVLPSGDVPGSVEKLK